MPQVNTETAECFAQDTQQEKMKGGQPYVTLHLRLPRMASQISMRKQHLWLRLGIIALIVVMQRYWSLTLRSCRASQYCTLHHLGLDTPPSPKKGDEDMEPGISCPSAVTPSAKPEPMAPSAHTRMFGKKHARGSRRLINSSVGIRRQLSVEGDSAPPSALNRSMPSSKNTLILDQMETAHQDISSQTPKLVTESLPSRMCTRSYGSQSSPKVCPQGEKETRSKAWSKTRC